MNRIIDFLTYDIKNHVEIEKYDFRDSENMTYNWWFENLIAKNLKCNEKFQFFEFSIFQTYRSINCFNIIMFVWLKDFHIQRLNETRWMR